MTRALRRTWRRMWSWTLVWAVSVPALAVVLFGGPNIPGLRAAPGTPLVAFAVLFAVSTAVAVAAAFVPWPLGRITFPAAATAAGATSLVADAAAGLGQAAGTGPPTPVAALWMLFEGPALVITAWRVARHEPGPEAVWLTALLATASVVVPTRLAVAPAGLGLVALAIVGAVVAGAVRRRLRADRHRAERAAADRGRRLELARDLHDLVGHEVTAMVLEAQVSRMEAAGAATTAAVLDRIEDAGQRALATMDAMVRALREVEDPADVGPRRPGVADLPGTVGRFAASWRARTTLDLAPDLAGRLPRAVDELAHHVVVEALTNIRRHTGGSAEVVVRVRAVGPALEVSVTDGGGAGSALTVRRAHGGTGLAELADRVGAAGGRLAAGRHGPGWRVVASLPIS